ncbi:MAG TPA: hypothetical protein VF534_04405 [Paraburkholderia sp.]
MATQVISPEEFIAEVNRRLLNHFAYETGMRVFLVPIGASGKTAHGYDWEPKDDTATIGVVAEVTNQVDSEFDVDPHISRPAHP